MPTRPNSKKKMTLDEAVVASSWRNRPVTRKRATTAGIIGLFFGYMGAHDFIMRHKKRGLVHLISFAIAFTMFIVPFFLGVLSVYCRMHPELNVECLDLRGNDVTLNIVMTAGLILSALGVLWGIVESIIILIHRNSFPEK